jgi:collagen triple helix repeat protein
MATQARQSVSAVARSPLSRCQRLPRALAAVAGTLGLFGAMAVTPSIAAGQSGSARSCNKAAFTGRVGAARPPVCQTPARGALGPRGRAGARGQKGVTGLSGPSGPEGLRGLVGAAGPVGSAGPAGTAGATGSAGATGVAGNVGPAGATGPGGGATGPNGVTGSAGATGATGSAGPTGPEGPTASSAYAEFYALMPSDNAATVAPGAPVQFPENGPTTGVITRHGGSSLTEATEFVLPVIGTYRVAFSASVTEAGQLVLARNSGGGMVELPYTVYGRAAGTSEISGDALVTTTVTASTLELRNPAGNSTALTITPLAGGAQPAVASLVIQRVG